MNIAFNSRNFAGAATTVAESRALGERVAVGGDEELVLDDRSERRPAELVEDKLSHMLKSDPLLISQLRMKRIISQRR